VSPFHVPSARAVSCIVASLAQILIASAGAAQHRYASAHTASTSAPNVVIVVAHDFAFDLAPSIPAGLTTFELQNRGTQGHHLEIVRLDSGKTASDALAALIKAGRGPRPAWMHSVGGPNAAMPGENSNATLVLGPGSYLAFCEIPGPTSMRHYMKGMVKPFTVTSPARPGDLPSADIVLNLVDYDFVLSHPLTRGHHVIAVSNAGTQRHMVLIKRFPSNYPAGTTARDLTAWALDPQGKPAPGHNEGGVTEISPGATVVMSRDFLPGRYLLICFSADEKDGKPHFMHGMQKEITIQ
jgi:uncharacterized cupredoxin-like copper-binding protein